MQTVYPYASRFRDIKSSLRRTGEPSYDVVTLTEIKRALDLGDTTSEDAKLNDLVPAAIDMVEHDAERALAEQTWQLKLDHFPCDVIELRKPPVQSVTSVTYLDTDGVSQTLATSQYDTDLTSAPARILPAEGVTWPDTDCQPNTVTVTFVSGYSAPIPRSAWLAIMMAMKSLYYRCGVGDGYWAFIDRIRWEGGV